MSNEPLTDEEKEEAVARANRLIDLHGVKKEDSGWNGRWEFWYYRDGSVKITRGPKGDVRIRVISIDGTYAFAISKSRTHEIVTNTFMPDRARQALDALRKTMILQDIADA